MYSQYVIPIDEMQHANDSRWRRTVATVLGDTAPTAIYLRVAVKFVFPIRPQVGEQILETNRFEFELFR